jgi:hypothetical protein
VKTPVDADLVSAALRQPLRLNALTPAGWDVLVRQARRADLLGRIASMLDAQGSLSGVPESPRMHLMSAMTVIEAQHVQALRELEQLQRAIVATKAKPVLLGASAYVAGGLLAALGRSLDTVDVLVPGPRLPDVDAALRAHGWVRREGSSASGRCFAREPTADSPPMRALRRHTVLDVHHAVVPLTVRVSPGPDRLIGSARPLAEHAGFSALAPVDMALHAMAHLFHHADLALALRALSDLDLLLRDFSRQPTFWPTLLERAVELRLGRPLYYGLRYASALLATPVPPDVLDSAAIHRPTWPLQPLADILWTRALRPQHEIASDTWSAWARRALMLRARWLRMPTDLPIHPPAPGALRWRDDRPAAT